MITIICPSCGKNHQAPDAASGRKVQCRDCGATFVAKAWQDRSAHCGPVPPTTPDAARQQPVPRSPAPGQDRPTPAVSPDEILEQYRKAPRPASTGIAGRASGVVARLRAYARAIRLRHEVGGLNSSIDGQWEALGMLMLQHHPAGIDLTARIEALSRIQADLAAQQVTLDALRQTKGSGPAAKETERDVRLLRQEQRQIMVGVGREAEAARVGAPGANGHYSALNTLRSTLVTKEAELVAIEEQVGPASRLSPAGGWLAQAGTVISMPLGLLLVVFFFLPWLDIKCGGHKIASASGLQLSIGKVCLSSKELSDKDSSKEPDARPWFALGLVIPMGLLAAAGMTLAGGIAPRRLGTYLVIAGLAGVMMMILAANVNYSQDSVREKDVVIKTEATGVLIASAVFYVMGVLCGFANLFLPTLLGKSPTVLADRTVSNLPP